LRLQTRLFLVLFLDANASVFIKNASEHENASGHEKLVKQQQRVSLWKQRGKNSAGDAKGSVIVFDFELKDQEWKRGCGC